MSSKIIKKIRSFISVYFIWPIFFRFFVIRWELFRAPPYYFYYYGYKVYYRKMDGLVYQIGSTGSFEKDVISCCLKLLPRNSVIIDVGANIGLITLPLVRRINSAVFHCFEPSPYPYQYFELSVKENKLDKKIRLNKLGLYDRSGRMQFYIHEFKNSSVDGIKETIKSGSTKRITVKMTTLDKYVKVNKIKRLDLIKADVEGSEYFVLKGGISSIKKFKPAIIFEAWPKNLEAFNIKVNDLFKLFKSLKYSIYLLNGKSLDLKDFRQATLFQGNFLALPDEKF